MQEKITKDNICDWTTFFTFDKVKSLEIRIVVELINKEYKAGCCIKILDKNKFAEVKNLNRIFDVKVNQKDEINFYVKECSKGYSVVLQNLTTGEKDNINIPFKGQKMNKCNGEIIQGVGSINTWKI